MFDMGFLELMVVLIVGLLVIGPDKLPGTIKTCVIWVNSIRRNLAAARDEFEKQIGADEIRREIHNHQVMESLRKAQQTQEEIKQQISSGNYTGIKHSDHSASADEPDISVTDSHNEIDSHADNSDSSDGSATSSQSHNSDSKPHE